MEEKYQMAVLPPFEPTNYYVAGNLPEDVQRVLMLPIYHTFEGDFLNEMDKVFYSELTKSMLFEVVTIDREELQRIFGKSQYESAGILPTKFFEELAQRYAVQAILFTDIPSYKGFKPISVGVRSKMVNVYTGDILWAFDTVFDAGNLQVAVDAKRFNSKNSTNTFPLDTYDIVLQSPSRFSKYVAYKVYTTLPKR